MVRLVCERILNECPSESVRAKMCEGLRTLGEMYLEASKGATGKDAPLIDQLHDMVSKSAQNEQSESS
jgi:hypothetical protein